MNQPNLQTVARKQRIHPLFSLLILFSPFRDQKQRKDSQIINCGARLREVGASKSFTPTLRVSTASAYTDLYCAELSVARQRLFRKDRNGKIGEGLAVTVNESTSFDMHPHP